MKNFSNAEVRQSIAENRLLKWEVAEKIGITDSQFSRWLRRELPPDKRERVLQAIEQLSKERGE